MMTSRRRKYYMVKAVCEVDKFSGIACSIIFLLSCNNLYGKNSMVTKFWHLTLGVPLITPHRVFSLGGYMHYHERFVISNVILIPRTLFKGHFTHLVID